MNQNFPKTINFLDWTYTIIFIYFVFFHFSEFLLQFGSVRGPQYGLPFFAGSLFMGLLSLPVIFVLLRTFFKIRGGQASLWGGRIILGKMYILSCAFLLGLFFGVSAWAVVVMEEFC